MTKTRDSRVRHVCPKGLGKREGLGGTHRTRARQSWTRKGRRLPSRELRPTKSCRDLPRAPLTRRGGVGSAGTPHPWEQRNGFVRGRKLSARPRLVRGGRGVRAFEESSPFSFRAEKHGPPAVSRQQGDVQKFAFREKSSEKRSQDLTFQNVQSGSSFTQNSYKKEFSRLLDTGRGVADSLWLSSKDKYLRLP